MATTLLSRRSRDAIDELEEALWLNPNFALGHMVLGAAHGFLGAGDEGLQHLAKGMKLSPRDPHQSFYQSSCALCHFVAGRYEESIVLNRRAVQLRPRLTSAWRALAAAAGKAGDPETATTALAETKRLQPELSADWVEKHHPLSVRRTGQSTSKDFAKPALDEAKRRSLPHSEFTSAR